MEDAYSWQLHSPAALEAPEAAAAPRLKWRGVSTARPGRSEAHVWISGRQVYLGSFVEPSHAAMAYDLASVHLRGETAVTNHPLDWYAAELEERDPAALDALVASLRRQAKALGAVAPPTGLPSLEPWELRVSEAISSWQSLGVFASEAEAARAAERALRARDGVAAAAGLNYPLNGYLPAALLPPAATTPQLAPVACPCPTASGLASPAAPAPGECGMALPLPAPVPRKASITPRATAAGDGLL